MHEHNFLQFIARDYTMMLYLTELVCFVGGSSSSMRPSGTPIPGSRSTIAYGVPNSNGPPIVQLDYYGNPVIRRSSENMAPPNVTIPKSNGGPMM